MKDEMKSEMERSVIKITNDYLPLGLIQSMSMCFAHRACIITIEGKFILKLTYLMPFSVRFPPHFGISCGCHSVSFD